MIDHILKKTTFSILSRRLNQDTLRHKVISHNIANVNTRGYQAKDVVFDDVLQRTARQLEMSVSKPNHMKTTPLSEGQVIDTPDQELKNGINNVDVDEQMIALAKNQLDFDFSATHLKRLFASLKLSITGTNRG
ncbi:flagellar basal body rod protein FlgB [candidate division KSB1 bacterium]|nr:flagellar basal body rod protein FlgB [candidate division KSB1 bacterium]